MFLACDRRPAEVGQPLASVETPAAIVDVAALRQNIKKAAEEVRAIAPGVSIRPHAKSHKCAEIAALQIALSGGATTGVCCQKAVEAEALVSAGISDVLLSNQIVDDAKAARLARLAAGGARIGVLVDSASGAELLSRAATAAGTTLDVLIELDVGQARCGVPSAAAAVALGQAVAALPGLRLRGIQAYHGAAQHVRAAAERRAIVARTAELARETRDAMLEHGLPCGVVTGGGTGTFLDDAATGVFTELQPGSYVFSDADYARNLGPGGEEAWGGPWTPSLFLLTQVMSARAPSSAGGEGGWAVLDSGLKAQSTDSGPGTVVCTAPEFAAAEGHCPPWDAAAGAFRSSVGHLVVAGVSDEHSKVVAPGRGELPAVGTKLLLMPGHCDPFVNHYDWLVAVEGGRVVAVWRLGARSPGL